MKINVKLLIIISLTFLLTSVETNLVLYAFELNDIQQINNTNNIDQTEEINNNQIDKVGNIDQINSQDNISISDSEFDNNTDNLSDSPNTTSKNLKQIKKQLPDINYIAENNQNINNTPINKKISKPRNNNPSFISPPDQNTNKAIAKHVKNKIILENDIIIKYADGSVRY
ncbi:MAG: hypothetical protein ACPL1A_08260 [Candidatus Kapaibacteriota bacterium]